MRIHLGRMWRIDEMVEDKMKVKDNLGQEAEEAYKESLERELEMFKNNLKSEKTGRERYKKQNDRQRKLWAIMMSDYEPVEEMVKMKFELNPEFWEIQRTMQQEKIDQEEVMIEGRMKKFDSDIAAIEEQIKEKESRLKELGE